LSSISCLIAAEPSAFDAGRLDSKNPYGLTETEKYLLNTNSKIQNITREFAGLKNLVENVMTRQDGVSSVIEGINSRMATITKTLQDADLNASASLEAVKVQMADLHTYVQESRNISETNQANVRALLSELTGLIDNASARQNELEKRIVALETRIFGLEESKNVAASKATPEAMMKDAEELYAKKQYTKAKAYFEELIARNHRPARCAFMLGEIAYFGEKWDEAITQYKKSAELYDKAAYMPKLLYHTAISFDKLGNTADANKFYRLIKSNYPDTPEAKASPNR
jgi:TolA-binding protein